MTAGSSALSPRLALAAVVLAALSAGPAAATTYKAAKELRAKTAKISNPAGVWSRLYGQADDPASYQLMSVFFDEAEYESRCGLKGDSSWLGSASYFPAIGFYGGPSFTAGQDSCAPDEAEKKNTIWMAPEATSGGSNAAILAWTAPGSGTDTVSGSVQPIESGITGIAWQVDRGTAVLAGPVTMTTDSKKAFKLKVVVQAGESVALEISHVNADGYSDTAAVTMNVTEG